MIGDDDKAKNLPERMVDFSTVGSKPLSIVSGTLLELSELELPEEGEKIFARALGSQLGSRWFGEGVRSGWEAIERCKNGWPEGRKKAFDTLESLVIPQMQSTRRRRHRGRTGDAVDMQRVWRGDLDRAWEYRARSAGAAGQSRVTIAVNIGANAGTEPDEMFWSGAAALRLADALEAAGRSTKIVSVALNGYGHGYTLVRMTAKDHGEVLDLDRIAAATAFPGAYRSVGFIANASAAGRAGWRVPMGLGIPTHADDLTDEQLDEAPNLIRVPQLRSRQAAAAFLEKMEG